MEITGIIDQCNDCEKVKDEIKTEIQKCLDHIYCVAITEISAGISKYKLYNNQLSFDDLIANLNKALTKQENPRLEQALQQKYKAVFIDEFQDTDRQQYEIFNKAFSKNTDLFYIGDPKQSIYAWRKADIFTYFKAREDVDHLYGMNINFRSTEKYIEDEYLLFTGENLILSLQKKASRLNT